MFTQKLQQILERQKFIDKIQEGQISTLKIKQIFYKASQQCLRLASPFQKSQNQQNVFEHPHLDDRITSLLKGILPPQQNSYEQIEQIENRLKLMNDKKFNQIQLVNQLFKNQKEQIMNSGLTVKDLAYIYQSDFLGEKQINDPLNKKIMTLFQANAKQHSMFDLLKIIISQLSPSQVSAAQSQDITKKQQIRRLRQSICSLQGLNLEKPIQIEPKFNEQTKKQMDKLIACYLNIEQLFVQQD